MRDIKFRAWDNESNEYGFFPNEDGRLEIKDFRGMRNVYDFGYVLENKDRYSVEQFTGLLDKNGVDYIFEGDIISEKGFIAGSIHEIQPGKTDIVIPKITSKNWLPAIKEAMDRGCRYS